MNLESERVAYLYGLLYSIALSTLILWRTISTPGVTVAGDLHYNLDPSLLWRIVSWNYFVSSPEIFNYRFLFQSWLGFITKNVEAYGKAVYFLSQVLTSWISFASIYAHTRDRYSMKTNRYIAASLFSFLYTFSPYVLDVFGSPESLLAYSLLPSIIYLVPKAVGATTWVESVRYGLLAGLVAALNFVAPHKLPFFTFFVLYLIIIQNLLGLRRDFAQRLLRSVVLIVIIGSLAFLLNAPLMMTQLWQEYALGSPANPITQLYQLHEYSRLNTIPNMIRLWKSEAPEAFDPSYHLTSWIVPAFSWFTIALCLLGLVWRNGRNRFEPLKREEMLVFIPLTFIALFLAKGTNEPLGGFYAWLVFTPFGWPFKYSNLWTQFLGLSYAFICSSLVAWSFENSMRERNSRPKVEAQPRKGPDISKLSLDKRVLKPLLISAILVASASVTSRPLLTGDMGGILVPTTLPPCYNDVNDWLSTKEGNFRVLWLPVRGTPKWVGQKVWGTAPVGHWASLRPISTQLYPLGFALEALGEGRGFVHLWGLSSVKYVVFHNDTYDVDPGLHEVLTSVGGVREVYDSDLLYVFQNDRYKPPVRALERSMVIVGSPRVLPLLSRLPSFDPSRWAIIFPEQYPTLGESALRQLGDGDVLMFYDKGFTDMVFSSLDSSFLYIPSNHIQRGNNTLWLAARPQYEGMNYEFNYGGGYIFSEEANRTYSFDVEARSPGNHQVWVRIYGALPNRERLSVLIDGRRMESLLEPPLRIPALTWFRMGDLWLEEGVHRVTLTNVGGQGNINCLAVVPSKVYEEVSRSILQRLAELKTRVVYVNDDVGMPTDQDLFVVRDSKYRVAVLGSTGPGYGNLTLGIDGEEFGSSFRDDENGSRWEYTPPIYLERGAHGLSLSFEGEVDAKMVVVYSVENNDSKITFDGVVRADAPPSYVMGYEKLKDAEWTITVNASKPFVLAFSESYHGSWEASSDGVRFEHAPLYSMLNGFFINKTGSFTLRLEFTQERNLQIGVYVSAITLVTLVALLSYLEFKERKEAMSISR